MKDSLRMVPEYSVVESQETLHTVKVPSCSNLDYQEVLAELAQLQEACNTATDILRKIRDSLLELLQSVQEQQ